MGGRGGEAVPGGAQGGPGELGDGGGLCVCSWSVSACAQFSAEAQQPCFDQPFGHFRAPCLPACRYDLANARDQYRFACGPDGGNRRLLLRYIEVGAGAVLPTCHSSSTAQVWSRQNSWPAAHKVYA